MGEMRSKLEKREIFQRVKKKLNKAITIFKEIRKDIES